MGRKTQISYYSKPLAKIHADANGICAECGEYVEIEDASRDHIIPRAAGGGNGRDNIQLMHKNCNNLKGHDVYPPNWQKLRDQLSVPAGYICQRCNMPISQIHKKNKMVSKVFVNGKFIALHTWCDQERRKYGKRI
jgi:DNA-directed RNA polymerase subunit RPC12/RpoP